MGRGGGGHIPLGHLYGPTWAIKNEVRIEKLLQGVTPLLQSFVINLMPILFFYVYFSSYIFTLKMWRKKK